MSPPLGWRSRLLVDEQDQWLLDKYLIICSPLRAGKYFRVRAVCRETERNFTLSRLILDAPRGMVVDHINGDTLDNRRENLRVCTYAENNCNRPAADNKTCTRFKGVSRHRKRWRAIIGCEGVKHYLGTFDTPEEAAAAHDIAARRLHGAFARLNFPDAGQPSAVPTRQAA